MKSYEFSSLNFLVLHFAVPIYCLFRQNKLLGVQNWATSSLLIIAIRKSWKRVYRFSSNRHVVLSKASVAILE